MKYRGIVYDVGLNFGGTNLSVPSFDINLVKYDMHAIAHDLHANAVRIEGEEISRLITATRVACSEGLTVFFNPWKMEVGVEETRAYLEEAAEAAETLRDDGMDIIFIASCEYTIFNKGVFPGDSFNDRVTWFGTQLAGNPPDAKHIAESVREKSPKLNEILRSFVESVRRKFRGQVTYSAGTWELVDWSIFDIVGIDYYRRGESEEEYVAGLDLYRHGKPLVVIEFGCCAYDGAAKRGDGGFALLKGTNPDGTGKFKDDVVPIRSEREQADYVGTQLELFAGADVHATFVFLFSFPLMPLGEGASDMDMMSFSLVKTLPSQSPTSKIMPPWEPKEAFHRIADIYKRMAEATV